MHKSAKQAISVFAVTLLVFSLNVCITIPAIARSADPPGLAVSWNVPEDDIQQTLSYWTPERMKAAKPVEDLTAESTTSGTTWPNTASGSKAPIATKQDAHSLPHSSYSLYPYSTIGKVFFMDLRTNSIGFCSGVAVASNNKSVVNTAGHCVTEGKGTGNWYTKWVFCPQYYYGSTPYGCWIARNLWTSPEWYSNGSHEDDFGEAVVEPNSRGYLTDVLVGTSWAYNQSAGQSFFAFGYPMEAPFDGNSIYYCVGNGTSLSEEDGSVVSMPCDMTAGSSGGPWFISIGGKFGYVNGHTSYRLSDDPSHMRSPYYDAEWYAVFNNAQNS